MKRAIGIILGLLLLPHLAQATGTGLDTVSGPQNFGVGGAPVGSWSSDRLTSLNGIQPGYTAVCDPTAAGTLRWNSAGYMEVCNGGGWSKLGGKPVYMNSITASSSSSEAPSTVNSGAAYDLCVLAQENVQDNGGKVHVQCTVSPAGGGTWDVNASLGYGYVVCMMSCFNFQ